MKHTFYVLAVFEFLHWWSVLHVSPVIVTIRSYTVSLSYSPRWGHANRFQ